ncbi:hypothetical protein QYE76_050622 [Lolium multiflorum]|uniref:Reverse transcriptase Ty1/copia-type domain-containing protein n=1 Tax=Lolium multiflorum TaxID=4521 RepID=A0AAD8SS88_LOLMU|nr:hypothetical protein QYE76_050622 [Lolium multiflorum]
MFLYHLHRQQRKLMIMIMKLQMRQLLNLADRQGIVPLHWYDPCLNVMIVDNNDEDPATYEEAMMSPDSKKWQEAMKSEMGSMYDNKVWTLVELPDSRKAVENKWIFKRKTDADGNITVYKARLVAKGFRQIQGVDYDETFSPVAKLKSVRILLAIAAFFDYEIWQMDVKTAFLNGDIEEELYMCTVAKSSTESEYIAASEASSEAVWMKRFIVELGVVPSALDPLVICDNMGAIANAQEPRSHKRLKHIKLRYHSIREYIEDGEVKICKVHTDLNVADPLTKALPRAKHDQHQNAMGVRLLAKDRRSLRLQRAKNVATITRLREKIRTLEVTVRTQQDQIQEMEEDGEDIQGGDDFQ